MASLGRLPASWGLAGAYAFIARLAQTHMCVSQHMHDVVPKHQALPPWMLLSRLAEYEK